MTRPDVKRYTVEGWRRLFRHKYDYDVGGLVQTSGPWHALVFIASPNYNPGTRSQAWCGSRLTGFHKQDRADAPGPTEKVCAPCVAAIAKDQPKSWRGR